MDPSRQEQVVALAMKELGNALERLAAQLSAHRIDQNDGLVGKGSQQLDDLIWERCRIFSRHGNEAQSRRRNQRKRQRLKP